MISINRNPTMRMLRQFSVGFICIVLLWGFLNIANSSDGLKLVLGVALVGGSIGLVVPIIMKFPYLILSYLTYPVGFLFSHLIIGVAYFGLITPVALLMRAFGRDHLRLSKPQNIETYWVERPMVTDLEYYLRQ